MKYTYLFAIALLVAFFTSCKTPQDIVYFQDVKAGSEITVELPYMLKVQPGDKLRILVTTQDPRLTEILNLQSNQYTSSSSQSIVLGYLVTSNGEIDFPCVGMVQVGGLTRQEIAEKLKKAITDRALAKDPVIAVDFLNLGVSVLGDVKNPGRYNILNDRYTILEALAAAGDLNITGDRQHVKVVRQEVGKQQVYEVNLLSAEELYSSPVFFLQQNDMVYVEPNKKRKNESTVNGNTPLTYSFWLTMCSFLVSVAVLIKK